MSLAAYPVMEARGERCAASCQGGKEGVRGTEGARKGEGGDGGEGAREGEKSAGWGTRAARVLEDNRHAGYDLHRVRRH
jgi:hypothetical protein